MNHLGLIVGLVSGIGMLVVGQSDVSDGAFPKWITDATGWAILGYLTLHTITRTLPQTHDKNQSVIQAIVENHEKTVNTIMGNFKDALDVISIRHHEAEKESNKSLMDIIGYCKSRWAESKIPTKQNHG